MKSQGRWEEEEELKMKWERARGERRRGKTKREGERKERKGNYLQRKKGQVREVGRIDQGDGTTKLLCIKIGKLKRGREKRRKGGGRKGKVYFV